MLARSAQNGLFHLIARDIIGGDDHLAIGGGDDSVSPAEDDDTLARLAAIAPGLSRERRSTALLEILVPLARTVGPARRLIFARASASPPSVSPPPSAAAPAPPCDRSGG